MTVLLNYMPRKRTPGNFTRWSSFFVPLKVKDKLRTVVPLTVIIGCTGKLVNQRVSIFLLQMLNKLQFDSHPTLIIAQIPDAFS